MSRKIQVPDHFTSNVFRDKKEIPVLLPNKHDGHVTVPEKWTGQDWEAFHQAGRGSTEPDTPHPWLRQWHWARDVVLEWHLKGLSTNPKQIGDDDIPFPLMRFLVRSVFAEMEGYWDEAAETTKEQLVYPAPADLSVTNYFAWERETSNIDKDDERSPLLKNWQAGRLLVDKWPKPYTNGKTPAVDGLDVDLGLLAAVDGIVQEVIWPNLNLGNLPSPPGDTSNLEEGHQTAKV